MTIIAAITSIADLASTGGVYLTTGNIYENVAEGIETSGTFNYVLPSEAADFWLSAYIHKSGNSNSPFEFLTLMDRGYSTTQGLFAIRQTGSNTAVYQIAYWNGSAWAAASAETFSFTNGVLIRLDFHVKVANAGGIIELYAAGARIATGVIDDTRITDVVTGIDMVRFGTFSSRCQWSAMIMADEDTRAMFMAQRLPTGNGANTAWTGAFGDVDETGINDNDFVTTTTVGAKETFTHAALPAAWASGFAVEAVAINYRLAVGQNSGVVVKDLQRIGGTDVEGAAIGGNAQYAATQRMFNQNPATSADWTMAEAASEYGLIAAAS